VLEDLRVALEAEARPPDAHPQDALGVASVTALERVQEEAVLVPLDLARRLASREDRRRRCAP
jgi:hypothetical protein